MGQSDSVYQAPPADSVKLNLGNVQFHDVHSSQPMVRAGSGSNIDFNALVNSGSDGAPAAPAVVSPPAPERTLYPVPTAQPVRAEQGPIGTPPANFPQGNTIAADASPHRPPHPEDTPSTGEQLGGWVTGLASLGATVIAGKQYAKSLRATETERLTQLKEVVQPGPLKALRGYTDDVVGLVAEKWRGAEAVVTKIAENKPHAFKEKSELMPPKPSPDGKPLGQQVAPENLIYHEVTDKAALTSEEMAITDRAEYLRGLEKTLVSRFDMPHTTTVSAYRIRYPNIQGLGKGEVPAFEGLSEPLNKLERLADTVMEETTTGRIGIHNAASSEIMKGMGILGGSFVASRALDHTLYGGKSQGGFTTAFDCAAPFLVFTRMSPMLKIGLMIGGHELVRAIEYTSAKNSDK